MGDNNGVFGVSRGIFDHPLLNGEPFDRRSAMTWLIKEVAWKPRRIYVCGQWIELERGQAAHSLRFIATQWQWSVKKVRGFLRRLAADGTVSISSKNGGLDDYNRETSGQKEGCVKGTDKSHKVTIITLCNYDNYQKAGLPLYAAKGTAGYTARAQEGHKEEEGKKVKIDEVGLGEPDFKKLAWNLNIKLVTIFGFDVEFIPPGWCGLAHALEAGLRGNKWDPEICRIAAVKLAAKKKPGSFTYLIKAIDTEHHETAALLKRMEAANVVQPSQREFALLTPVGGRQKGPGLASLAAEALRTATNDRRDG